MMFLAGLYAAERRPAGRATARALIDAATTASGPLSLAPPAPLALDALAHDPHPGHDVIKAALPYIVWSDAGRAIPGLKPDWASGMLVNELLGPSGQFYHPELRIGLYVQCAGFHYGLRAHPAEETYILLGGRSAWATGAKPFRGRKTGEVIFHPSMIPHQTLTRQCPLIATWRWSGEIGFDGYAAVESA
jgi:hypothetical protein